MTEAFNHYEWNDEKLHDRLALLGENKSTIEYTPERRAAVSREIACIAFELSDRERERRGLTIAEAWGAPHEEYDSAGA